MMSSYRLVRLIESNADALADGLEEKVKTSSQVRHFRQIPPHELREQVHEIYRHLGEFLLGNNEMGIENRYREIGAQRARQNVPLSEVIQAVILTKENLWEFLKSGPVMETASEILGELKLMQMLTTFFDRAIYHLPVGFEEEVRRAARGDAARAR
jgi:hypothetical protein